MVVCWAWFGVLEGGKEERGREEKENHREGEEKEGGRSEGMYTHLHVLNQCCSVQISAAAFNISAKLIATDKVCGSWCQLAVVAPKYHPRVLLGRASIGWRNRLI